MNSVGYSFSSLTYNPKTPPSQETNFEEHQCYLKGEELIGKAARVTDFFTKSDNSAQDLDPRPGYVRLNKAYAPECSGKRRMP
ncbi:hypothetical protein JST97_37215, partial [bacterium]|nr:hypothetical protein [bacterium]